MSYKYNTKTGEFEIHGTDGTCHDVNGQGIWNDKKDPAIVRLLVLLLTVVYLPFVIIESMISPRI